MKFSFSYLAFEAQALPRVYACKSDSSICWTVGHMHKYLVKAWLSINNVWHYFRNPMVVSDCCNLLNNVLRVLCCFSWYSTMQSFVYNLQLIQLLGSFLGTMTPSFWRKRCSFHVVSCWLMGTWKYLMFLTGRWVWRWS